MNRSHVGVMLVYAALVAGPLGAQDLSTYRGVSLGDSVQRVVDATDTGVAEVQVVHRRPALMQDLEWRPGGPGTPVTVTPDPVQRVLFSFYNDRLYRVLVRYHRVLIDGLTDGDLIASLSATYGTPSTAAGAKVLRESETIGIGERQRTVVARWEDMSASIVLVRGGYLEPLNLVLVDKHVANDARYATAEAVRLDIVERPARDATKARADAEAARLAQEKARPANKAGFKP